MIFIRRPEFAPVHAGRLARWLGEERAEGLSEKFRHWYGPPVVLLDVPGGVKLNAGGEFTGIFQRGSFGSAMDALWDAYKRAARAPFGQLNAGFTSISDALSQQSQGKVQSPGGMFYKSGSTGVSAASSSLWRTSGQPVAGAAGSAAPGGRQPVDSTDGGMPFTNPSVGTSRLVGADVGCSVAGNSLLLYDRIFDVAKTMSSTATEAVTGVPLRYTSTTSTDEDYAGGNFVFPEVGSSALGTTAHNWATCRYQNQAGTTGQNIPSLSGVSGAIVDRIDTSSGAWFMPLSTGDTGIRALTQMQCSASVAGSINFVIGHPIAIMALPAANCMYPYDFLTNKNQAPRVIDDACLTFLELQRNGTGQTVYTGRIYLAWTAS